MPSWRYVLASYLKPFGGLLLGHPSCFTLPSLLARDSMKMAFLAHLKRVYFRALGGGRFISVPGGTILLASADSSLERSC